MLGQLLKLTIGSLFVATTLLAHAQADYPSRPVKLIVPYAPGGAPDVFARATAARLSEAMGQPFVVENKPGAGGIAATEQVAKSDPDGYTLLIPDIAQLAINPALFSKLPYDSSRDFAPVSPIGTIPFFLVAQPSSKITTVPELIAVAKSKPNKLSYGTSGVGSMAHILMESFARSVGIELVHVPFKGSGASTPAFLGGHVDLLMATYPAIGPHVKAGNAKILGISSIARSTVAPDATPIADFVPGYNFVSEIGVVAPAGTPPAIVNKLSAEVAKAVRHPETVQRFNALGAVPSSSAPEAYAQSIRQQLPRFAKAVKDSGAKASD